MEIKNFTPIIDMIVQDLGIKEALVYGSIWRFANQSGICYATHETIGKRVGISHDLVSDCAMSLVKNGYLREERHGRTVHYFLTDKVRVTLAIGAELLTPPALSDNANSVTNIQSNIQVNKQKIDADASINDPTYEPCDDDGNPLKPKKVKNTKKTEPTHPAIIAYRRITGRYPAKVNYDRIIEVVGEEPDELFMHKCFSEWMTVSQNPAPYKWLFEWYAKKSIQKGWKPAVEEINEETRRKYKEWENS